MFDCLQNCGSKCLFVCVNVLLITVFSVPKQKPEHTAAIWLLSGLITVLGGHSGALALTELQTIDDAVVRS